MSKAVQTAEPMVVDAQGRPMTAGSRVPPTCPACGAPPQRRVRSCGFGVPHDVCACGHEFKPEESQP